MKFYKRVSSIIFGCVVVCVSLTQAELISNDLYAAANTGDTVWVLGSKGFSYIAAQDTPFSPVALASKETWFGLAAGGGKAVAPMYPAEFAKTNQLFVYENSGSHITTLPFNSVSAQDTMLVVDLVADKSAFWFAASQGGLVKWTNGTNISLSRVYWPRLDSLRDTAVQITDLSLKRTLPDGERELKSVALSALSDSVKTQIVYVASEKSIWQFREDSLVWKKLSDDTTLAFLDLFASPRKPGVLYALRANTKDTALYLYNAGASPKWKPMVTGAVWSVAFGEGDTVYTTRGGTLHAYNSGGEFGSTMFTSRVAASSPTTAAPQVRDVLYIDSLHTGSLFLATDQGLLYSLNERSNEKRSVDTGAVAFSKLSRSPTIAQGLKESYAVPGILTPDVPECYFAYNLKKSGNVTITLYDFNMDFVKTVVNAQYRNSGASTTQSDGRSTNALVDRWNGTNNAGKPVAPGLYYYVISSSSGEQGRGKIIVAK